MTDGPPELAAAMARLAELHRQGALSAEAYAQAQAALLGNPPPPGWGGWGTGEQPTQFVTGTPGWDAQPPPPGWGAQAPPGSWPQYPPPGYPPHPTQPYAAQWARPPRPPRTRWSPLLVALGLVVVLVAGAVFVVLRVLPGETILEPAASAGPDPFTDSVVRGPHMPVSRERRFVPPPPAGGGVPSAVGTEVGLYGDVKGRSSCDREQMITFLTANPGKGEAWAAVQGIPLSQVPAFLRGLTPAVLRQDTRVTNHGFAGGRATPRQAVLEAGTRVLVDEFGVPRAKCGCGNPLAEPVASGYGLRYSGDEWPDFDEGRLLAVAKAPAAVDVLTLTDLDTGGQFDRPVGSDGASDASTGQVQVRLTWRGRADLDLRVTEPNGTIIYFNAKSSGTGGTLDVDANANCLGAASDTQVNIENVFWPAGQAPVGSYTADVTQYNACSATSSDFQIRATVGGRVVVDRSGSGASGTTVSFSYDG